MKKNTYKTTQAGFTLIELMVSLSLFVVVVLAVVGSLYSVNQSARKAASMRAVLDNINFASDVIARTIRTGSNIICAPYSAVDLVTPGSASNNHNCPMADQSPSNDIIVKNTFGVDNYVEFAQRGTSLQKRTKASLADAWGDWVTMTGPEVSVTNVFFYVDGANVDDGLQPSVIIFIRGTVTAIDGEVVPFAIQTMASQRATE